MYNQKEYIYNNFVKNYTDCSEPIAIYGIGDDTKNLLAFIKEYNIIGCLDRDKKSGEICGVPIIDYSDVVLAKVKKIVVVTRPAVIGIIYNRISDFAKKNNIFVGDVNGRDLAKVYEKKGCDHPYFHKNWDDLRSECEKHDVISFDIFDTLLVRQIIYPKNIFEIVMHTLKKEKEIILEFVENRCAAEDELYRENINPTIYQIYERIQRNTQCGDEVRDKYLKEELHTEKKFIKPRESMLSFYNSLKEEKNIFLISDMYLPSDFLSEVLHECGYTGYKAIYVSCEHNCSKRDGLFLRFLSDNKPISKCLHIGDNEEADGNAAQRAGIDNFLIMSELEMMETSSYSVLEDNAKTILDKIAVGLFCNRVFDDPFVLFGSEGIYTVSDSRTLSYMMCAPEILYFSCWLIDKIRESDCDYIFYPSRDAYILQKICKILVSNQNVEKYPNGEYLYISRRTMYNATLFDASDIDYVSQHEYHGKIEDMYKDRYNIDVVEPDGYDRDKVKQLNRKYEQSILEESEKQRTNYIQYLEGMLSADTKKIAFIDFIAAGTIQNGLRKLITDVPIQGFYFMKRNTDDVDREKHLNVVSFYKPQGDFEIDDNIYKYYLFFEMLLTSPEPTLLLIDEKCEPVFFEDTRTSHEISIIMEMQEAVLEYVRQMAYLHPCIFDEKIGKEIPDIMIGFLGREYSNIACEEIKSMVLTDEYLSKTFNVFDK